MHREVDIVSDGRSCAVTDDQFDELQDKHVDWSAYCTLRRRCTHEDALAMLAKDKAQGSEPLTADPS